MLMSLLFLLGIYDRLDLLGNSLLQENYDDQIEDLKFEKISSIADSLMNFYSGDGEDIEAFLDNITSFLTFFLLT